MRYYLARYTGTGTDSDPFRVSGMDDPAFRGSIDLRPDCTVADGFAIAAFDTVMPTSPARVMLTDDPDELSATLRTRIENRLALNLEDLPFRRLVMHLLRDHGDDGNTSRWNRLRPVATILDDGRRARQLEVWLGGLLDRQVIAADGPGTTLAESFNKADSTTLGPDLTWAETNGDSEVSSNAWRPVSTASVLAEARAEHDLATVDHYSQAAASFQAAVDANTDLRVLVRCAPIDRTHYMVLLSRDATQQRRFIKRTAGATSNLTGLSNQAWANGDVMRLEVEGSTLRFYRNGALQQSTTDVSIATGVRVGVSGRRSAAGTFLDSFAAGDLAAGSVTGTAAQTLPALTQSAAGRGVARGPIASTLPALTQAATGRAKVAGPIASTLPALTQSAAGAGTVEGGAAGALPALAQSSTVRAVARAAATATLPALTTTVTATAAARAAATSQLPALQQAASTTVTVRAVVGSALPALTQSIEAAVEIIIGAPGDATSGHRSDGATSGHRAANATTGVR